jgi:hypothetical protein
MNQKDKPPVEAELDPLALPAPQWVTTFAYFFRFGLGLFLALSVALSLLLSGCNAQAAGFWSSALSLLNMDQVSAIIADNSSFSLSEIPNDWREKVRAHQDGNLFLIDFNSDRLCGRGGCLYVGYLFNEDSQQLTNVLSLRLNPQLPPSVPLFEIDLSRATEPPCLKVHQLEIPSKLLQHTFCFNGTEYVKESTIAKPIERNAD